MAYTVAKVGTIEGNLEEFVKKYSSEFIRGTGVMGNTNQYVLYTKNPAPRLIMTSQPKSSVKQRPDYNFIISITSDDEQFNLETLMDFNKITGISLRKAPRFLDENANFIGLAFDVIKEHGDDALKVLTGEH